MQSDAVIKFKPVFLILKIDWVIKHFDWNDIGKMLFLTFGMMSCFSEML